jgi:predicted Zn finger-like uncharacterized protein
MNVSCPQCTSVFRVDPAKVPGGGVRARCSVCSGVINIPEPSPEETVAAGGLASVGSEWGPPATPPGGWTPAPPAPEQSLPPIPLTPPGAAPTPVVGWGSPAGTATPADWGDWPHTASPFDSRHEVPPASRPAGTESHGLDQMANPLTPEMPTPSAAYQPTPTPASQTPTPPPLRPAVPLTPARPAFATPPQAAGTLMSPGPSAPAQASRPGTTAAPRTGGIALPTPPQAAQSISTPAGAGGHVNPVLRRDPHERAQRLSRALVSDIVTYYPEKHAEGVRDGTLRELFRDEIKKSYDDYVTQVGTELAQSTTYFQDALNEILGGGRRLF